MTVKSVSKNVWFAILASLTIVALSFASFILAEPQIGHTQVEESFLITQVITGEATFLVDPTDVTMDGAINGITGGRATGTTQFVVQSNSTGGHRVDITFGPNSGQYAMIGDATGSEDIVDYEGATSAPTFAFATSSVNAQFAYTVTSSTTDDTALAFQNDDLDCGQTGGTAVDVCWMTPSTTAFTIVDRGTPAPTGATTSIKFRVDVQSGISNVPTAEGYTATATLSLFPQ